jgi:hypothetical protein
MTSYTDVSTDSEQTMISSLMQQLVSIAIEAFKSVFQLYKFGVLSGLTHPLYDAAARLHCE